MNTLFQVHTLNDAGMHKAVLAAEMFDDLLAQLDKMCGSGREFSLVKTHLELACFYAKKAIATQAENQSS